MERRQLVLQEAGERAEKLQASSSGIRAAVETYPDAVRFGLLPRLS